MKKYYINFSIPTGQFETSVAVPLLQDDVALAMALFMDKQIANALITTPQVGTEIKIGTSNFLESFAEACSKVAPYKLTAIAMTPDTFPEILPTIHPHHTAGFVLNADGDIELPGFLNVPIILSKNIVPNDEKKEGEGRILFISNKVPAVIKVNGGTEIQANEKADETIFQYDFIRCVKSNIKQTDGKNQGVVSIDVKW